MIFYFIFWMKHEFLLWLICDMLLLQISKLFNDFSVLEKSFYNWTIKKLKWVDAHYQLTLSITIRYLWQLTDISRRKFSICIAWNLKRNRNWALRRNLRNSIEMIETDRNCWLNNKLNQSSETEHMLFQVQSLGYYGGIVISSCLFAIGFVQNSRNKSK